MVNIIGAIDTQKSQINQVTSVGLPQSILSAIKNAAVKTGVDFSYLVKKAAQESGFDPNAKASSSSATGLYQFTQQTWMQMVKSYGAQNGLDQYADHITTNSDGSLHADKSWKDKILGLRNDPQVSAVMAGELDKENMATLQQTTRGKVGGTELYLAHFLGAGGASSFINEMQANPNAKAADILPEAAEANPNVFYNTDGSERSLKQIYQHFAQKFDGSSSSLVMANAANPTTVATTTPTKAATAYAIADSASTDFTPSVMSSITKPTEGSLFATMVLAQSDMNGLTSGEDQKDKGKIADHNKTVADQLATMA